LTTLQLSVPQEELYLQIPLLVCGSPFLFNFPFQIGLRTVFECVLYSGTCDKLVHNLLWTGSPAVHSERVGLLVPSEKSCFCIMGCRGGGGRVLLYGASSCHFIGRHVQDEPSLTCTPILSQSLFLMAKIRSEVQSPCGRSGPETYNLSVWIWIAYTRPSVSREIHWAWDSKRRSQCYDSLTY
jgi:hypothetical protein